MQDLIANINGILTSLIGLITFGLLAWSLFSKKGARYLEAFKVIEPAIRDFMEEAEKIAGLSGKEKRDYVINKAKAFIEEKSLKIPIQDVENVIEELIKFSKLINK